MYGTARECAKCAPLKAFHDHNIIKYDTSHAIYGEHLSCVLLFVVLPILIKSSLFLVISFLLN